MITPESALKVFKVFRSLADQYPHASIDMVECDVHICGSPMCHAGWYAFSQVNNASRFEDGAERMAHDLGFDMIYDLKDWARENPLLWGNENGIFMFRDPSAFESKDRPEGATSLSDIADHWEEVSDRLSNYTPPEPLTFTGQL